MNLRLAVKESALFLDRVVPDWTDRINTRTLDIACPELCIIGQIFGPDFTTYARGLQALDCPEYRKFGFIWDYAIARGFAIGASSGWEVLTALWRKEIECRRNLATRSFLTLRSGQTKSGKSVHAVTGTGVASDGVTITSRLTRVISCLVGG